MSGEPERRVQLFPRQAAEFIATHSKDVTVCPDGITLAATKIREILKSNPRSLDIDRWSLHELNPKTRDEASLNWIFVVDLLNFSFWSVDGQSQFSVTFGGRRWTGYWSLCAAINRALDEGIAITDPHYYGRVTRTELEHILRSDTNCCIPLLDERLRCLHQAAAVLIEKYDGRFSSVVSSCGSSAVSLYRRIADDFPVFRDEPQFEGQTVGIYKRAQILVGDIWACFGGSDPYGHFDDIDNITAFADYRIPQVLVAFGALKYSDRLRSLLDNNHMFISGDRMEVEIRGCTLWSIELIVRELKALLEADATLTLKLDTNLNSTSDLIKPNRRLNSIIVDHFLWDYRRDHDAETSNVPFHKIRCIYY